MAEIQQNYVQKSSSYRTKHKTNLRRKDISVISLKETIPVYSQNYTKRVNTPCEQNPEFYLILK
jgi:hypothetical protein